MYRMLKYARYLCVGDEGGGEGGGGAGGSGEGGGGTGAPSLLDGAPAGGEGEAGAGSAAGGEGGDGRPEWLTDQRFWSPEEKSLRGEQLFKSYRGLEEKLGAHKGSPKDAEGKVAYDLGLAEDLMEKVKINSDDPYLETVLGIAEKYGVSQECFSELLNAHAGNTFTQALEDYSAEMGDLGSSAKDAVKSLVDWGSAHLDAANYGIMKEGCTTAAAVRMAQMLIQNNGSVSPVPSADLTSNQAPSNSGEYVAQIDQAKYKSDANYRGEVDKRIQAWDDKGAAG